MSRSKSPPRISKKNLPKQWTPVKVRVNPKGEVELAINPAKLTTTKNRKRRKSR